MEWYPRYRWLWIAIVVLVLLSTLFTHQHYLPDLGGGLILAKNSLRFGEWWMQKRLQPPARVRDEKIRGGL
jgi:membrane-associated phospholipid phosphatase